MKNKNEDFKAVEFMLLARKRLTKKYQDDKKTFEKESERSVQDFLKLRKKKKLHSI